MKREFKPIQHYKVDKKTKELVLDENGNKIPLDLYKGTSMRDMLAWIKENGTTEEKAEFKKQAYLKNEYTEVLDKNGNVKVSTNGKPKKKKTGNVIESETVNILSAKKWFFTQFAPEYLPEEEEKGPSIADLLAEL